MSSSLARNSVNAAWTSRSGISGRLEPGDGFVFCFLDAGVRSLPSEGRSWLGDPLMRGFGMKLRFGCSAAMSSWVYDGTDGTGGASFGAGWGAESDAWCAGCGGGGGRGPEGPAG